MWNQAKNSTIAFLEMLQTAPLLADGGMGSYLFERTGRLSEPNHIYEAFNVNSPDLIRELHFAYLRAGARCLTTNTFAANRSYLVPAGEGERIAEINRAGVRLAHEAITTFRNRAQIDASFFVLGSIGPTREASESPRRFKEIYLEQIESLLAEGADALQVETFTSLPHLSALLELIRGMNVPCPLVVQMSLRQIGPEDTWEQDPMTFMNTAVELGARVAGVNCCAPWEATAFVEAVREIDAVKEGRIQLSAMPNAGGLQRIGNRYMTHVNQEYMGKLARTLADSGVRLIGGCCEVHPPHIREMHNYLSARRAGHESTEAVSIQDRESVGDDEKKKNGPFSRKIKEGVFAVSVEMLPSRGTSPNVVQDKIGFVAELAASGLADALDVTDGSRGIPLMPPGDFISVVRERLGWTAQTGDGLECIPHFTTRDLNVMGLQSRLIGYWAQRIHNVLIITGDPPKMSPTYPRSTAVFDLDSIALIRYTHACLNAGVDFGGRPLGRHDDPRTHFSIGTGFEPEALNGEREIKKLRQKIDNGADYVMSQPAFHFDSLDVLDPFRRQIPILVGVMVLVSRDQATRVSQVPGVVIPGSILDRLGAFDKPADQAKVGREIAVEQVRAVKRAGWSGLYLMSPATHRPVREVLEGGLS